MRNEKLVEATMLALRGKLLEEVDRDFKKVLDYINGDYHRVEDFTDLEVCYPNEEDTDWLDAYDVANELLNKLSKEDWATMAKEIDDGTLRDKLIDWGMKAGSLEEARSHKEDNEKVAPRTTTRNGKEVKITDMQKDLDNTFVGKRYAKGAVANNPYYGGQYYGTTDAEYRSKRNKTGQKRTSNIDMSKKYDIYKADTFETPVTDYQFAMDRYKSYEKTGNEDMPIAQSYKKSAQDIVNKERERIANKSTENKKVTEAIDEKSLEISIDLKNKTYQEWFDEMKNKYGLVYQYTSVLGPKDAPVGKIYVFKDNEDYNYAITNGKEFNRLYDDGKLTVTGKKDTVKKVESEEDAINVMNNFRDKDALYGYVVSYLENNAPNNEEILKLCKEILAKGAINVCGKDKINDFYNKCKSDIEARINALGENYVGTILAQYVFEDVIYGLEDNLESAIQK